MELCTDRTADDVAQLQALSDRISKHGVGSLSTEERQLWFHGDGSVVLTADSENIVFTDGLLKLAPVVIRGAYNAADFERVDGAMSYLRAQFRGVGYEAPIDLPSVRNSTPREADMTRYLRNLTILRGILTLYPTTPPVPASMDAFTWKEANDIEQMLLDIEPILISASRVFRHSGAAMSGMGGLIR